jgi:hypothetical protein
MKKTWSDRIEELSSPTDCLDFFLKREQKKQNGNPTLRRKSLIIALSLFKSLQIRKAPYVVSFTTFPLASCHQTTKASFLICLPSS